MIEVQLFPRGYKVKLLPTEEQCQHLEDIANACRYFWNWAVNLNIQLVRNGCAILNGFALNKLQTSLKRKGHFKWLKERKIPSRAIKEVLLNVWKTYKQNKYIYMTTGEYGDTILTCWRHPKFKSKKRSRLSFMDGKDLLCFPDKDTVYISMVGKVKVKYYYPNLTIPTTRANVGAFSDPHIYRDTNGNWFLSFVLYRESQAVKLNDFSVGVDLNCGNNLVAISYDNDSTTGNLHTKNINHRFYKNINKKPRIKRKIRRRKHLQRELCRCQRQNGSCRVKDDSNHIKQLKEKIRHLYNQVTNMRNDHIHKISRKIVDLLPKRIILEDLKIKNMLKNKRLRNSLLDAKFAFIKHCIMYKAEELGIEVVLADTFFPSSKTCSNCNHVKEDLKLSDRTYVCPHCGAVIDRDVNAARNLEKYTDHWCKTIVRDKKCATKKKKHK